MASPHATPTPPPARYLGRQLRQDAGRVFVEVPSRGFSGVLHDRGAGAIYPAVPARST